MSVKLVWFLVLSYTVFNLNNGDFVDPPTQQTMVKQCQEYKNEIPQNCLLLIKNYCTIGNHNHDIENCNIIGFCCLGNANLYNGINQPKPTLSPTNIPSHLPTITPTKSPTKYPTKSPTNIPRINPTNNPTEDPTPQPSPQPTRNPSLSPSKNPSFNPTDFPTPEPTLKPSLSPSDNPTLNTLNPSNNPTDFPTPEPTNRPPDIANIQQNNLLSRANIDRNIKFIREEKSNTNYYVTNYSSMVLFAIFGVLFCYAAILTMCNTINFLKLMTN